MGEAKGSRLPDQQELSVSKRAGSESATPPRTPKIILPRVVRAKDEKDLGHYLS
jgi:hypothetical protein